MKILTINGSAKNGGFTGGALDIASRRLMEKGAEVEMIRLADLDIRECVGCNQCLKTGECPLGDDMAGLIEKMKAADGFVVGSPVRNQFMTAVFKRFMERSVYLLGFPLELEDKPVMAISSVGAFGGRGVNKKALSMTEYGAHLSSWNFFTVGHPAKMKPDDARPRLEQSTDRLYEDIRTKRGRTIAERFSNTFSRLLLEKFLTARSPDQYAGLIRRWREKGREK